MQCNQSRKSRKILPRVLLYGVAVLLLIVGLGSLWFYQQLRGSLPMMNGDAPLAGLTAPVTVDRDALGLVTLRAGNRLDLARAIGLVHAQERYFQMDLLRRSAAGELSELFGAAAVERDRAVRLHRFRNRARDVLTHLPEAQRVMLEVYSAGVNAGLAALAAPPFEYLLLRDTPVAWRPEDSLLAIYAMYQTLQDDLPIRESMTGLLHDTLDPALADFLDQRGSEWDAPLQGGAFATSPPPGPDIVDLRRLPPVPVSVSLNEPGRENLEVESAGSNNWAVAGNHTAHGGALLANDMHLSLNVPNIWFRAAFVYPDEQGEERRIDGVTLPGVPAIVVGSNGHIAWGFTNSQGDWADLVELEPDPHDADAYLTAQGPRRFQHDREIIRIKHAAPEELDVLSTQWGPVYDADHRGRRRALRWVAHDRDAVNLDMLKLETANSVPEALDIAAESGLPEQNFVVADADGHIGWTLMGRIPRRFGHDGRTPRSWADGDSGWDGWVAPTEYPRIIDPPSGRLWTANARVVSGDDLQMLGFGGYRLGARAKQIRDALLGLEQANEADMLALQLDDRALFLVRWRDLLLHSLESSALAGNPRRQAMYRQVANWGGRAAVDSVGYRLVREFRTAVTERVMTPLTQAAKQADATFDIVWFRQYEGPLWWLISEQPAHLLAANYADWRALFLAAIDDVIANLPEQDTDLPHYTWGAYNTSRIQHPFSRVLPGLGRWLDMPALPLPGDTTMPRVQGRSAGASERLAVSPGHEETGLLHMPAGQSGHPLSPHYRDGHSDWVQGSPRAFLPGPVQDSLRLLPAPVRAGRDP
ncbi:MAG: penicillin acylase family protein [Gammaproteobacteria bacterium]|nr:penicillin acylase family protein [Gammaproteobacteria bacterium]MCP5424009.1 penicillin acylase family protein [Gammaproteobacteria bacterium]